MRHLNWVFVCDVYLDNIKLHTIARYCTYFQMFKQKIAIMN
jgi:hypothetical protein